jgi:pimeloyl-ACP methyl ester carboxylesterase
VDVVALRPWGSDFFRLVSDNPGVFARLPAAVHRGVIEAYVAGASHGGLRREDLDALVAPWLGEEGQAAFYRQIEQADEAYTDEIESRYPAIDVPTLVVWGQNDTWIPVDRAHRLHELIPDSRLRLIADAGHLVQLDRPATLTATLTTWLTSQV